MGILNDLAPILEESGYLRNYAIFGDGNLRVWDWKSLAPKLPPSCELLWRFFLCGEELERERIDGIVGSAVLDRLIELELCTVKESNVCMGDVVLISYQRRPVFLDMEGPSKARIGDDVHTLVTQICSRKKQRILSLYSSGGSESFLFLENNGSAVTVRPSFGGESFARANWELNGIDGNLKIVDSNDSVKNDQFDLILARIPSMVTPEGYDIDELESGGRDGLDGYRSVFETARASLAEDGELNYVGLLFGSESSIDQTVERVEKLAQDAGLVLELELLARQRMEPGTNLFNQAIFVAEKVTHKEVRRLMDDFMEHFESNDWNFAHYVKGSARRRKEDSEEHRVLNVSEKYFGTWAI